jgi:hypothetical protein
VEIGTELRVCFAMGEDWMKVKAEGKILMTSEDSDREVVASATVYSS